MSANLLTRLIVALFGIPAILAVCYYGSYYLLAFSVLLSGLGSFELQRMFFHKGIKLNRSLAIVFPIGIVIAGYYDYMLSDFFIACFIFSSVLAIVSNLNKDQSFLPATVEAIFGWAVILIYCGLACAYIPRLGNLPVYGGSVMILIFFTVWATDTGAYFGGRAFGKAKLAPGISPGKTVAGFYGGFVGAIVAGAVGHFVLSGLTIWQIVIVTFLACLFGQMGDLFESAIKRYCGVKDSSAILPGHGGILDRFDSLLIAVPVVYFALKLLV